MSSEMLKIFERPQICSFYCRKEAIKAQNIFKANKNGLQHFFMIFGTCAINKKFIFSIEFTNSGPSFKQFLTKYSL